LLTNLSHHVVHDAVVSNKHLRIYTIIFDDDNDQSEDIAPLVYAEDLSRNGSYWNGSLVGKGNGVLLSAGDTLRVSPRVYFQFQPRTSDARGKAFDLTQECEMRVSGCSEVMVPANLMQHFEKEYVISDRKLGSGACGAVYMAIEQSRQTQLACKVVDLRRLKASPRKLGWRESSRVVDDVDRQEQLDMIKLWSERKQKEARLEQELKVFHREASILATLCHPNIIGLEKVFLTDSSIYIFQDLITGGDLFSYLERKNGKLSDVEAAVIVRQILIALQHLHDQNIVHRDLKPENILMTSLANGCRVVLTDFGHAKKIDHNRTRMTTLAGTEQYTAPEIYGNNNKHLRGKLGYTKAVDMWSLGCVTVVLLTGGSPFVDPKTNQYSQKLAQECNLQQLEKVPEWKLVGKRPKDFVERLLVLDEEHRMTARDAQGHLWFSNEFHRLDFQEVYNRAIRYWRPRTLKSPVIELVDAEVLKELPMMQNSDLIPKRNNRSRSPLPIDPPYKPYPRKFSLSLLPKRRPTTSWNMSEEARSAIAEKWSYEKMHSEMEGGGQSHKHSASSQTSQNRSRPSFTAPFRPLVLKQFAVSKPHLTEHIGNSEGTAAEDTIITHAVRQEDNSEADSYPIETSDNGSYKVGKDTYAIPQGVPMSQEFESAANPVSSVPPEESQDAKIKEDIREARDKTEIHNQNRSVCGSLPPDHRKILPTLEPNLFATARPRNCALTVPRLRLRSSKVGLRPRLSQSRSMKRRRDSIYDLEDDEDGEEIQGEYTRPHVGCADVMLSQGRALKRVRSSSKGHAQLSEKENGCRPSLRGGEGFSGIKDGFTTSFFIR
jgi:serine/threonine protein kinase